MGLCTGYTHAPCWKGWGTGDGFAQFSYLLWVHILEELNSQKLSICVEGTLGGWRESALTNENAGALLLLQMYAMRKELVFSQWAAKLTVAFLPSCISWSSILQRCSSDDEVWVILSKPDGHFSEAKYSRVYEWRATVREFQIRLVQLKVEPRKQNIKRVF